MITKKTLSLKSIYRFSGQHLLWLVPWMLLVTTIYHFTHWKLITLPWLPLSLIGTAVAFYVGFKNNQSYERLYEARKIWGAMVNHSRKLATTIKNYQADGAQNDSGQALRKQIIYRHIAYLYQLREQLLKPTPWEHVSLNWVFGSYNEIRRNNFFDAIKEELDEVANHHYLSDDEKKQLDAAANKATQLMDRQTQSVQALYQEKSINMMQQIEIQGILNGIYDEQGKAERIKNYPFPRQYASFSFAFVCIFVFLLPFGIVGEFSKLGEAYVWLSVPIGVVIGWIYVVMEMIGDYSENPFEGLHNDIPMLAICRIVEIDLLQMIGDPNVPKPIQPKDGVLF
ncbi:bestrophin family protein [Flavobacterium sp.]|uniref:bestrophin family protein n=1 Tax=Flavobacterium sp. TaxID=239 RepID=UPI0039E36C67